MKCPVCKDVELVMSERQGVEIDYCPSCRGVWLDRGELDKIIEKASSFTSQNSHNQTKPNPYQNASQNYPKQNYNNESNHNSHHSAYQNSHQNSNHNTYQNSNHKKKKKKKKEGFLSEIFDFDF